MIRRDVHRYLKGLSRERFSAWLYNFYKHSYNDGVKDNEAAVLRRLVDDFGFTEDMINTLHIGKGEDIDAINQNYISAEEIIEGLVSEGFKNLKGE